VMSGKVFYNVKQRTEHKNEKEFFNAVFKLIDEVLSANKLTKAQVGGIGVGIAGMVLADKGVVVSAVNLGLVNVPLAKRISDKYGVEVRIDNDVGMFALSEYAASGLDNLVYVAIGTGINAGVINRGKLFSGAHGASIEFGHSSINNVEGTGVLGAHCACGLGSCVGSYISGKAIMASAKAHGLTVQRPEDVFALVQTNSKARDIKDDFLHALTHVLVNICNIYRPQAIFIGGGLAPLIAPHIEEVKFNLQRLNYGYKNAPAVEVKISEQSALGGVLGAALLFG